MTYLIYDLQVQSLIKKKKTNIDHLSKHVGKATSHYADHVHQQRCRTGGESWGTKIT